jgi:rod shape-determining protein MreC
MLASLTLLTLDARGNALVNSTRVHAVDGMRPLTASTNSFFKPFQNTWNGLLHYGDVKKENEQLRAELEALRGKQSQIESDLDRQKALEKLVNVPSWLDEFKAPGKFTNARVVGAGPSNFDQTVQIDKGSGDGVKLGYPVVNGDGLVGNIVGVTAHTSRVRLVTDSNFAVGIRDGLDPGDARGRGLGQPLEVVSLAAPTDTSPTAVKENDVLKTSGLDVSLFPAEIPVARVTKVREAAGGLELFVDARPVVDLNRIDVVKVLGYNPPR